MRIALVSGSVAILVLLCMVVIFLRPLDLQPLHQSVVDGPDLVRWSGELVPEPAASRGSEREGILTPREQGTPLATAIREERRGQLVFAALAPRTPFLGRPGTAIASSNALPTTTPSWTQMPIQSPTWMPPTHPSLLATPSSTPLFVLLDDLEGLSLHVTPTRTPVPTPTAMPDSLFGKIAFRSDLFGRSKKWAFLVEGDGTRLAVLLDPWAYETQLAREAMCPSGPYLVQQRKASHGLDLFLTGPDGDGPWVQVTFVGSGKAYDPAWSPVGPEIAFASNQELDDDIFVVSLGSLEFPHPNTRKLTQGDDWASDKHPSYSPEGDRIVYYSNTTGRNQIWIMNADGSDRHRLVALDADCWDPVWIKP